METPFLPGPKTMKSSLAAEMLRRNMIAVARSRECAPEDAARTHSFGADRKTIGSAGGTDRRRHKDPLDGMHDSLDARHGHGLCR